MNTTLMLLTLTLLCSVSFNLNISMNNIKSTLHNIPRAESEPQIGVLYGAHMDVDTPTQINQLLHVKCYIRQSKDKLY